MGLVGRKEVEVKVECEKLLLNGSEDGARVLEDEGSDGKKRTLGKGEAGAVGKRFSPEKLEGCDFEGLGDIEMKPAE